jgi:microcystin degradation protein MlrC
MRSGQIQQEDHTMTRVAVGGYLVAVNTFATQPLGLQSFQRSTVSGDALLRAGRGDSAIAGFMQGARERNWEVVPLHFVLAGIGGKATDEAHEWAKAILLTSLRNAGKVDGVFLQLHGTAVSDSADDCEGDLLAAVRGLVGDKVPIIASLDGHANVTPLMVEQASMLIGVKTNPHYDFVPVGRQAARDGGHVRRLGDSGERVGAAGNGSGPAEALYRARMADGAPDAYCA